MTLPTFKSKILLRLYEERSFVRAAFTSMGSAPNAKITVDTTPASTGNAVLIEPSLTPYWPAVWGLG
jgi:hypothetical protein